MNPLNNDTDRTKIVRCFIIPRVRVDMFIDLCDILEITYEVHWVSTEKYYLGRILVYGENSFYLCLKLISKFVQSGFVTPELRVKEAELNG